MPVIRVKTQKEAMDDIVGCGILIVIAAGLFVVLCAWIDEGFAKGATLAHYLGSLVAAGALLVIAIGVPTWLIVKIVRRFRAAVRRPGSARR